MSSIIEDRKISEQYASFLQYIPNHFHVTGQCQFPHIVIPEIDKFNPLAFPLSEPTINKIKALSQSSPFGLGTKTVHDSNIRRCSELEAKQFSFSFTKDTNSKRLSSRNNECLEAIRKSLAPRIGYIDSK